MSGTAELYNVCITKALRKKVINLRVVILGGQGQTGSYLSPLLLRDGHGVMSTQLRPATTLTVTPNLYVSQVDITNQHEISETFRRFKPHKVVNLASLSSVYECERNPELSYRVNFEGVCNVVNACLEYQQNSETELHLIQAGSSEMYVGLGTNLLIDENTPLSPKSTYGTHKAQAFEYLAGNNLNLKVTQAILFNHESPRRPEKFVSQKIVQGVISILKKEIDSLHFGDMSTTRDWSFAGDVARALYLMLKDETGTNYIVGSNSLHSVEEFYLTAAHYVGLHDPKSFLRLDKTLLRASDNDGLRANNSKIMSILGWEPEFNFYDLVEIMMKDAMEKRGFNSK